jgi:hypothetical protein
MGNANLRCANILIAYMELLSALMDGYSPMVVTTARLGFGAWLMAIACKSYKGIRVVFYPLISALMESILLAAALTTRSEFGICRQESVCKQLQPTIIG